MAISGRQQRGVDTRLVAAMLAKDLSEPLPTQAELTAGLLGDGAHPYQDRDEVQDIYRSWRAVFNEYTPPRMGVAEAWVPAQRRVRFAAPEGLGEAFNFDLLTTPWLAKGVREVIEENLRLAGRLLRSAVKMPMERQASRTWRRQLEGGMITAPACLPAPFRGRPFVSGVVRVVP